MTSRKLKSARADVTPVRQRTQFSCMAASMAMALRALSINCTEDEVANVMGVRPMRGATWEDALAAAQHYGCRATLCVPATISQVKEWTDIGDPVLIAWNPEGRDWSHASVVFDVTEDHTVHVADPNIPDPDETVRVVPRKDFYGKWSEKWPRYLVRRPAMRISREITSDGRQVMAGSKKADESSRFQMMNTLRQHVDAHTLAKHIFLQLSEDEAESFLATLSDLHSYPMTLGEHRVRMLEKALQHMSVNTLLDEMARELPEDLLETILGEVGNLHKVVFAQSTRSDDMPVELLSLDSFASTLEEANRQAKFEKGKEMSAQDVADYLSEHGAPEAAKRWMEEHEKNKDNFEKKASPRQAKFEKGKEMSAQDVADYLSEHGAPEAAKRWMEEHEKNKDNFEKKASPLLSREAYFRVLQAKFEKGKEMSAQDVADYLSEHGAPEAAKRWMEEHEKNKDNFEKKASPHRKQAQRSISEDLLLTTFRGLEEEAAADLAAVLSNAKSPEKVQTALRYASELLDGFGLDSIDVEGSWDNFFGEAVAWYVNTGDTFNPTVLYDVRENKFHLTSWGSWVEKLEQQGERIKAAHWDEVPATVEDWLSWRE